MSGLKSEQLDYPIQVLTEKLQEDVGNYVAQEMLKRSADEGNVMATLFGSIMKDTTVDEKCYSLNGTIQILMGTQKSIKAKEEAKRKQEKNDDNL